MISLVGKADRHKNGNSGIRLQVQSVSDDKRSTPKDEKMDEVLAYEC